MDFWLERWEVGGGRKKLKLKTAKVTGHDLLCKSGWLAALQVHEVLDDVVGSFFCHSDREDVELVFTGSLVETVVNRSRLELLGEMGFTRRDELFVIERRKAANMQSADSPSVPAYWDEVGATMWNVIRGDGAGMTETDAEVHVPKLSQRMLWFRFHG